MKWWIVSGIVVTALICVFGIAMWLPDLVGYPLSFLVGVFAGILVKGVLGIK